MAVNFIKLNLMEMNMQYNLVIGHNIDQFNRIVELVVNKEGWRLQGGVCVIKINDRG